MQTATGTAPERSRVGYGRPLDAAYPRTLLQYHSAATTPFNVRALRALARRATERAEQYNASLLSVECTHGPRWALYMAALGAMRRLERAVEKLA